MDALLPDDLAKLEQQLSERGQPEPTPSFRPKMLAAIDRELIPRPARPDWSWLLVAASLILVWLNFSMSMVNNMDWGLVEKPRPRNLEATAQQVQRLAPELTPREAYRQALLLLAQPQGTAMPYPKASLNCLLEQRKRASWNMH